MLEVIVATYNNPQALHWSLLALSKQSTQDFRICVADDGSGQATRTVVAQWQANLGNKRFRHVWHPDEGFTKNRILNKAIASSECNYLVFIDGDCLTSPQFISRHMAMRQPGWFLSGGLLRMPRSVNPALSDELVQSGQVFDWKWLRAHGCANSLGNWLKIGLANPSFSRLAEKIAPLKRVWNGSNSSGWRADLLKINGFDESMAYGSEDVEMGVRLQNMGIQIRLTHYSAPILHIDHQRGYVNAEVMAQNKEYTRRVSASKLIWTEQGIVKAS
jgi:glycosyltransferase involved in cell wall biosynthesis